MKITIVGAPFNGDGTPPESENPPQAIREAGLISLLRDKGHDVTDIGDLLIQPFTNRKDSTTKVLNFDGWQDVSLRLSEKLVCVLDTGTFPIVLGGDCSILMGIMDAYKASNVPLNLFFLDGHADFHNIDTSPSGEPADMELAALTGYLSKEIVYMTGRGPLLDDENVVVYGINEYDQIKSSNIQVVDRMQIKTEGAQSAFNKSISILREPNLPIWLHIDVDVLDKSIMPAVNYPVEKGLSYDEALALLSLIVKTNRAIGISVACYHPNIDQDKIGIGTIHSLLNEIV